MANRAAGEYHVGDVSKRYGSWVTRLLVLVFFAMLSVAMTWPLVLNLRTAIPGPPWDNFVWLYDLWWFRHSIVELGEWPAINPTIFYPYGYDLSLSETMYANKLLIAPVLFWADEVVAYNVLVLLTFVLTGYTTYLLIAYLTDNRLAAAVGGVILAFSPYRMHALAAGWLPLLATQWVPLVLLYLERMFREERARYGLVAGLFLGLTFLSSWYYVFVVGGMLAVYLLFRLRPWRETFAGGWMFRHLALVAGVVLVMVLPIALPVMLQRSGQMSWSLSEVEKWAASVEDLLLPGIYHPFWGEAILGLRPDALRYPWYAPGFVSLGVVASLLALKGLVSTKMSMARALLWMGVVALVLALGVALRWNGRVVEIGVPPAIETLFVRVMSTVMSRLALQKASLYEIAFGRGTIFMPLPGLFVYLFMPLGGALRTFYRFGVMSMLAVSVLAGFGVAAYTGGMTPPFERRQSASALRGRYDLDAGGAGGRSMAGSILVTMVLLVAVLAEFAVAPLGFGLSDVRPQPLDNWLAARPAASATLPGTPRASDTTRSSAPSTVVMQFPLVRALSGDTLYRTKFHGQTATYGHGTFYPDSYWYAMPLLGAFPSAESLRLLQSWGVTHVIVGSGAYDAGWGDQPDQSWRVVEEGIQAREQAGISPYLHFVGILYDEPFWHGERVSHMMVGNLPVTPILVDKIYVYELR